MEIRNIESTDIARALQMAGNVRMEYSQEQLLQMAAKGQVTIAGCYAGSELLGWAMADDKAGFLWSMWQRRIEGIRWERR